MISIKNANVGSSSLIRRGKEYYDLSYLEDKLGVTRDHVKVAIAVVGNDAAKVEEYLNSRKYYRSTS